MALPSPATNENNDLTNFIRIFFNFTYYLGVSPFRIIPTGKVGQGFQTVSWRPQKVICGFMDILCIFRILTELRISSIRPGEFALYPELYFRMILRIFALAYKVTTLKRFWMNRDDFIRVLDYIKNTPALPFRKLKIQNQSVIRFVYGLSVGIVIMDMLAGMYFVGPTWRLTPSWWLRQLVAHARYSFLVGPLPQLEKAPELYEIHKTDIVLAVIAGMSYLQRYIIGLFSDLCILSHVITLWSVVYEFAQKNRDPSEFESNSVIVSEIKEIQFLQRKWDTVYNEYKAIRKLAMLINKALGNMVTGFMAEAIIFYSINLDVTLVTVDLHRKLYMFYFYFHTVSIFFGSADICNHVIAIRRQMDSLKVWLAKDENRKDVPFDEIQIVLQEIRSNDIGIRGSGIFTITYALAASYCSLVVTYFIISVQHRNQLPVNALDG